MPIYEFECRSCDHRFEELVKANGAVLETECPRCGSQDVARLLSVFAVHSAGASDRQAAPVAAGGGGCCGGACGCR